MSEPDYKPPTAYAKFPFTYNLFTDIWEIHTGGEWEDGTERQPWPHTTLWLLTVCAIAKDARKGGALIFGGCPIGPRRVGIIPCWERIPEAWARDMIRAGLFSICPDTGAIVVECRDRFYEYPSDSPEARRERQSRCRDKKRAAAEERQAQPVTSSHAQVTTPPVTDPQVSRPVTTCHDFVTTCHEPSRPVTTQDKSIQDNSIQDNSIQSVTPSECASDRTSERAKDRLLNSFQVQDRVNRAGLDAAKALKEAFRSDEIRRFERFDELIREFAAFALGSDHTLYETCTAIRFAGLATAWTHRDGPGVGAPGKYFSTCLSDWLEKIRDREMDREACKRDGEPDPGSLEWIAPDKEAMLR